MAKLPETANEYIRRQMEHLSPISKAPTIDGYMTTLHREKELYDDATNISKALSDALGVIPRDSARDTISEYMSANNKLNDHLGRIGFRGDDSIAEAIKIALAGSGSSGGHVAARIESAPPMIKSIADLAPLIRKARKAMKMNQQQFADAAGVGRRFLSELENGKPSLEFDKVLACALAAGIDIVAKPRKPD